MEQYTVAICRFPGSGWEHMGCVTWLMELAVTMSQDARIKFCTKPFSDTPITMTRNAAVKEYLAAGIDYILMVDSDVIPDYLVGSDPAARPFWPTAWNFMMAHREGGFPPATIAVPYCGPPPDECCYVFHWRGFESESPLESFRLEMITREDAARRSGIEEVAALPTGLILYDARVFQSLPPPWFSYEWADREQSVKASTEDVFQTRNASMLKLPQYVLWDSWAAHAKTKIVRKPSVLTRDMVHQSLVEAVERGHVRGEKLHFRNRHDVPTAQ